MSTVLGSWRVVSSVCLAVVLSLAACASEEGGKKQGAGVVLGAAVGGVAGYFLGDDSNRAATTLVGAAVGGLIGNEIGKYLDEQDRKAQAEATARALASQESSSNTVTWENEETGVKGTVTAGPVRHDEGAAGDANVTAMTDCRTVVQSVKLADGTTKEEELDFCKGADGSWSRRV